MDIKADVMQDFPPRQAKQRTSTTTKTPTQSKQQQQQKQGLCKSIKNICNKYGNNNYFKENRTIRKILALNKDKDKIQHKSGIIYWYKCEKVECNEEYIEESSRTFEERYKEHLRGLYNDKMTSVVLYIYLNFISYS